MNLLKRQNTRALSVAAPDAERRVEALFEDLEDQPFGSVANHLTTVNTPDELDTVRSSQQRGIERDGS